MIGGFAAPLQALSIGQRLTAAAVVLVLWAAPAGAVWLYMHGKLSAQFDLGKAECVADQATALNVANADALSKAEARQVKITERAAEDAAAISKTLRQAMGQADKIQREFNSYASQNPLPAGCRADPERVRKFNESRQAAGAAGSDGEVRRW